MKKKMVVMVLLMVLLVVGGCVSATYDPETGLVKYERIGNMNASEIDITLPGGAVVKVGSLENSGFNELMKLLENTYKAGLAAGAAGVAP